MIRLSLCLVGAVALTAPSLASEANSPTPTEMDLTQYVDPFIGTGGQGHTFPGATMPFGMVQVSPSAGERDWKYSSGYHYDGTTIKGFAHTHLSGAGLTTLGDILLMPARTANTAAGTEGSPASGYRSRFSHADEAASPGYYRVQLTDPDIRAELTASTRVGYHRYTYAGKGKRFVILDPTHGILDFTTASGIEIVSNREIRGFKKSLSQSSGDRGVYFVARFSQPFIKAGITDNDRPVAGKSRSGKRMKAFVEFSPSGRNAIEATVAISHVSAAGAQANLNAEGKAKSFDAVRSAAKKTWQDYLARVTIDEPSATKKRIFYTALYRTAMAPNLISDVTGDYYVAGKAHRSTIPQYSNFSSWDTYRALHPLLTIIDQKSNGKLIASMVSRHSELGRPLPLWEALGHDNQVMIGYAIVSPIADAVLKHIPGVDPAAAYEAIRATALDETTHSNVYDANGAESYRAYGFVSADVASSVSKTTEQNYSDWTVAQVASKLGKTQDAALFAKRATGWRFLYDRKSGDLVPRFANGRFASVRLDDWGDLNQHYVSGNIWAYSAYTPHDMKAAIALHGGRDAYARWLEDIFTNTKPIGGEQHVDLSGFVGRYGHGDEPGHHMAYLFNLAGQPWRTQYYVNRIAREMYSDKPDGLVNNEDLGQMSAWYIFSTLGFYPVAPGDLTYQIGAPSYREASIRLEDGKRFQVIANNVSADNIYIQSATLNGAIFDKSYLTHDQIMGGGTLIFEMGAVPNKKWGNSPAASSLGNFNEKAALEDGWKPAVWQPYDPDKTALFEKNRAVRLRTDSKGSAIHYTLDGDAPSRQSPSKPWPVTVKADTEFQAIAAAPNREPSPTFRKDYFQSVMAHLPAGYPKISIAEKDMPYGRLDGALLIDQQFGTRFYPDRHWSGRKGDITATLDLGSAKQAKALLFGFLNDPMNGIMPPRRVEIWSGDSPDSLALVGAQDIAWDKDIAKKAQRLEVPLTGGAQRYFRIKIISSGDMPVSISEAGIPAWLFVDELVLR